MSKKICFLCVVITALVYISSCTKDKTYVGVAVNCTGVNSATNTFSGNIYPNITSVYCAYSPCHGGGTVSGGVDMSTYAATVTSFKSQNVICAIKNGGCELMPKNGPALPDSLIQQMECWQSQGYPQ